MVITCKIVVCFLAWCLFWLIKFIIWRAPVTNNSLVSFDQSFWFYLILCSCVKCFLIQSIMSFKKSNINSCVIFSLRKASRYLKSYRHFDGTKMEHQRRSLSKPARLSSFSLANPWQKNMLSERWFEFFKKNLIYKEKCGTVKK